MAGEFHVSWGIFDEYCVEEVETRFPEISEVELDKMKEGYQNKNTKQITSTWLNVFNVWRHARGEEIIIIIIIIIITLFKCQWI